MNLSFSSIQMRWTKLTHTHEITRLRKPHKILQQQITQHTLVQLSLIHTNTNKEKNRNEENTTTTHTVNASLLYTHTYTTHSRQRTFTRLNVVRWHHSSHRRTASTASLREKISVFLFSSHTKPRAPHSIKGRAHKGKISRILIVIELTSKRQKQIRTFFRLIICCTKRKKISLINIAHSRNAYCVLLSENSVCAHLYVPIVLQGNSIGGINSCSDF